MSSPLFSAWQYFKYLLQAVGPHSLHSPFLFDLYNQVIKPSNRLDTDLEDFRKSLMANDRILDVVDFKTGRTKRSTIGNVARLSLSQPKFSNFLRLLCEFLEVKNVVETGTSLAVNAHYIARAKTVNKVASLEGSEIIHRLAYEHTKTNTKIELVNADLYQQFEMLIVKHQPELVFLDADHRGSAIDFCLSKIKEHLPEIKCIVIHDINWSRDMKNCWSQIIHNQDYALTVDLFQAGLIFPTFPIEKQHFTLRF